MQTKEVSSSKCNDKEKNLIVKSIKGKDDGRAGDVMKKYGDKIFKINAGVTWSQIKI